MYAELKLAELKASLRGDGAEGWPLRFEFSRCCNDELL
jgi:hypothetical protein